MYQHAKIQAFLLFCCRDIVDLKILLSDWLRAFGTISQEPDFFSEMGFVQDYSQ